MTEEPRNWDKELADVDKAMAKQPAGAPPPVGTAGRPVVLPQRRFVALTWFWTALALILAIALPFWPDDKTCGLSLAFYLGAAVIALLMGALGALASWSYRRGLAHLLSLLAIVWSGVMATREILPRVGYAEQELRWTCPEAPPPAAPEPEQPAPTGT